MQITAAVLRDRTGRYELEEVSLAEPGPGQILVRIVGVGHCHTDLLARAAHPPAHCLWWSGTTDPGLWRPSAPTPTA